MVGFTVKEEREVLGEPERKLFDPLPIAVIGHDCTDESKEDGKENGAVSGKRSRGSDRERSNKKQRLEDAAVVLPIGFLDPLPPEERLPWPGPEPIVEAPLLQECVPAPVTACKQFWKAGDYEGDTVGNSGSGSVSAGIDHVRVHPKSLHSNATSHKWALGAFAELLNNSLDEICNGASFVNIDMLQNKKDKSRMLFFQDNGGGMDPNKMRQCMSLGYSAKSKSANTIGQYGNGFKTSTMRLGADVIVFSRCKGKDGKSPTQSIGLLSYTFLRNTGKEDIVVPIIDYEKEGKAWKSMVRSSRANWNTNLETIVEWSPFYSEDDLLQQLNLIEDQGTRIIIYNLWEDDQGELELDFSVDPHDIQIRGVNRDEKKIQMAKQFPNSMHFLTYRHSLRSYVSILYLRLPLVFKIILRGKDGDHHNIAYDMIHIQEITYKPQSGVDGPLKDSNMVAVVTIGFVKDANEHIDVQGFNVYHKNRLIKPFWRVWNVAGSNGRGVLGVLEANFVEPAHDKQGFERTIVLQRLEMRLIQMQKTYWGKNCEKVGYAPRQQKKQESSLEAPRLDTNKGQSSEASNLKHVNGQLYNGVENIKMTTICGKKSHSSPFTSGDESGEYHYSEIEKATPSHSGKKLHLNGSSQGLLQLATGNLELKNKNERLEAQKLEEASEELEALIDIFSGDQIRRDKEEETLRKKLRDASATIQGLLEKERLSSNIIKQER
ncbi:protein MICRORCHIDIA 7-like [Aristolochia californica]|uniref:protein MICRORCHIDIA 7-like n=1 Tax=Aristolochia californica TaxID=171875 RepID=UPI0035D6838F